jgi:hypothetical protein
MTLLTSYLTAHGPIVLAGLGLLGLLYQTLTSKKVDSLKAELTLATEQKTDAVLATQQTAVETTLKQAEVPIVPPVRTQAEVLTDLDKV